MRAANSLSPEQREKQPVWNLFTNASSMHLSNGFTYYILRIERDGRRSKACHEYFIPRNCSYVFFASSCGRSSPVDRPLRGVQSRWHISFLFMCAECHEGPSVLLGRGHANYEINEMIEMHTNSFISVTSQDFFNSPVIYSKI